MISATFELGAVLRTALQAALEAGDYFKSRFATELVIKTKSSLSDLVTDVDPYCERLIRDQISARFPEHRVLGEESVAPGRDASMEATRDVLQAEAVWIVDPLDGTTNFVHAIPLSVVSIAFASRGSIQMGVIYDPYRGEVFFATHKGGAHLASREDVAKWLEEDGHPDHVPGMRLHASKVTQLPRAVLATGLPMRHRERGLMMTRTAEIIRHAKSLRAFGAAALHLAYVAAGRIDVFWEYELNAWDVAAGVLLMEEAGGCVNSIADQPYTLMTRDIMASGTRSLSEQICAMLNADA